jgi:hypothetical protein
VADEVVLERVPDARLAIMEDRVGSEPAAPQEPLAAMIDPLRCVPAMEPSLGASPKV